MNREVLDKVIDTLEGPSGLKRDVLCKEFVNALPLRNPAAILWYALCEYRPLSAFGSYNAWRDWQNDLWDAIQSAGATIAMLKVERDRDALDEVERRAVEEADRIRREGPPDESADPLRGVSLFVDDDQVWDDEDYPEGDDPDGDKTGTPDEYARERGVWEFQRYLEALEQEDEGWKRNERSTRRHQGDRHER